MSLVYIHINKLNPEKKYIGRSDNSAISRWGNQGIGYKGQKFYKAGIEVYGWDNFIHKVLIEDISPAQAIALETYLIQAYDSINKGYNDTISYCSSQTLKEIQVIGENLKKIIDNIKIDGVLDEESLATIPKVGYSYRNTTYPLTVIRDYWNRNKIFTELDIQRGLVWNEAQQQELWDTLLCGARIPEVHVRVEGDGSYSLMDGKQRITTCMSIISDQIPLKKSTLKNEKHQRMMTNSKQSIIYFSQLPVNLQQRILDNQINFAEYYDMSDEEMANFFKKLNNGTSLSEFQKTISQNFIFRKNVILPIIIQEEFLQNFFCDNKKEKNQDELFVLKTLYLFSLDNIANTKLTMNTNDTQKMIDALNSSNLTSAISQFSRLLTIFKELNITAQDFERENKRSQDNSKRINDALRPFIFAVLNENIDKKHLFKKFLKEGIFLTSPSDRSTPAVTHKYYVETLNTFNKFVEIND